MSGKAQSRKFRLEPHIMVSKAGELEFTQAERKVNFENAYTGQQRYQNWSNTSKPLVVLQPLRWCCVDCVIHHERDVREEQKYMYVARTSNKRVISSGDLYCCLLPQCEALRTCRSGFPIATVVTKFWHSLRFY